MKGESSDCRKYRKLVCKEGTRKQNGGIEIRNNHGRLITKVMQRK